MKAQVSIEFFIFVSIVIVISISFSLHSATQIKDFNRQKESDAIKDLAIKIQREIFLASNVEDGYFRKFDVPSRVSGYNYTIAYSNSSLSVSSANSYYLVRIPSIVGNVTNGTNRINKTNGVIYVN